MRRSVEGAQDAQVGGPVPVSENADVNLEGGITSVDSALRCGSRRGSLGSCRHELAHLRR